MIFGAAIGTPFPGHTIDDFEAFIEKEQGVTRGAYSAVLVINLTTETSYLVCKGHDGKYHEVARYKGRIPRVAIMPTRHVPSRPEQSGAASEARAEGTNRETLSHPEDSGVLEAISLYRAVDVGALAYRASCDPAGLRLELRNNTESPLCVVIPDGMVWESGDGVAQTVVAGG
ncbi:MAG: hypothetical protein H5T86_08915 [Armatimonadetes bacterium]|nr:hypothetical protein [Armatimonadota bacterium]